jgi:hypothetical protein
MSNLLEFIAFVKDQANFHAKMALAFGPNSKRPEQRRAERHQASAQTFNALANAIQEADRLLEEATPKPIKPKQLSLGFDEIEDLPDELLQELSISDGDRIDYLIVRLIEEGGGVASLDRLLVGLYRATGEVLKRATLTSRIYRMSQKGLIFSVPGRKGVYSIRELSEAEANALLGN